jgi:hypothetical protein
MRRIRSIAGTTAVAGLAALVAPIALAQQAPRFRAVGEVVIVPVSVTDRNRPVSGLGADDFEILDNGVRQTVIETTLEPLSMDVTLVVDTSGSVDGPALGRFKADLQEIALALQPNDRVRLVTFGTNVADTGGLQPGGAPLPLETIAVGGATSFYNAIAAVLMAVPPSERPQLVVGFSDGLDNMSFLDARTVAELAGHANAALYLSLTRDEAPQLLRGLAPWAGQPDRRSLRDAAERTGGELFEHRPDDALPALFRRIIDGFRTKYLLRYTPAGVAPGGWHEIVVRVKGRSYTVRARKGYQGG